MKLSKMCFRLRKMSRKDVLSVILNILKNGWLIITLRGGSTLVEFYAFYIPNEEGNND